jgi:hypothetical protein
VSYLATRLARTLRGLAGRLDPPALAPKFQPGEQLAMAEQLCAEMELVRALRASLRAFPLPPPTIPRCHCDE